MLQIKSLIPKKKPHNIVVFNTVLWGCSFIILLFLFSGNSSPTKIDYIYTSCFLITLIIPVSLNLYLLIPRYLKKEHYLKFCLFFILNLILFSEINPLFFNVIVGSFFKGYFFISYHNKLEIYFIFFIFFALTTLIKLAENWVYLNQIENDTLKSKNQQIEKQLYYLKGQINPHFLFNSLNVLYSLAIEKNNGITSAILQLSDILRYIIYDIDADKIVLKKEVDLIKNYIAFEKNRHIKGSKIKFDYNIKEKGKIYPMLLLPLVENSFKHGLKSGIKNPYIEIKLKEEKDKLTFIIKNNYKNIIHQKTNNLEGVGLKNIKEILSLIYPNKHSFSIEAKENTFSIRLIINLE